MKSEDSLDGALLSEALATRVRASHSNEVKACAIELAELYSTAAAARMLGIATETIWEWRRKMAGYTASRATIKHTPEAVEEVLARAEEIGVPKAAAEFGVTLQTAKRWRRQKLYGVSPNQQKRYSADFKAAVVLEAARTSVQDAARGNRLLPEQVREWMRLVGMNPPTRHKRHPDEEKQKAISLAREHGCPTASLKTGVPEATIAIWLRTADGHRRSTRDYSPEERTYAVRLKRELGSASQAARILGMPVGTLNAWDRPAEERVPISHDQNFTWLKGSDFDDWRHLASEWVKVEPVGLAQRLEALRAFFKKFVIGLALPRAVKALLLRSTQLPDFYETCCPKTGYGVGCARYTREFIDWVLIARFSTPDVQGRPVVDPAYRNPIKHPPRSSVSRHTQTVYSPLPMGYMDELQQILAPGPHFTDWKWAQRALYSDAQNQSPDWFPVTDEQIDDSDPDCVWRIRIRARSSGGPIKEMWSPVRWVGLLIKNIIPLRTTQTRVLDSGEADKWTPLRNENGGWEWNENKHALAGMSPSPQGMGAIRRSGSARHGDESLLLYVNTNKTRDALLTGSKKGYDIAWPPGAPMHSDPFYWLLKLRTWQEKYNPIERLTSWKELGPRHIHPKTDAQLATYAKSCFLFRMPENASHERHLPLTLDTLDPPWFALLKELEERLWSRGETLPDGSRIELVVPGSLTQTLYPLHALRVSILSGLALDGKVDFPVLMRVAGHSRFLMTLYYTVVGEGRVRKVLAEGLQRVSQEAKGSIVAFLRQAEREKIVAELIVNDPMAVAAAIPQHKESRTAAGWLPVHLGLCLMGGNTMPNPQSDKVGGCFNGGPNEGTTQHPVHGPVPGGARNCASCRWLVTDPSYLPAFVAEFNNTAYHQSEAALRCVVTQNEVNELLGARAACDARGDIFPRSDELKERERQLEQQLAKLGVLSRKLADCLRTIERCISRLKAEDADESRAALVVSGSGREVKAAIEHSDSELSQLIVVCQDAETYPELDAGKAVVRLGQVLDAAMLNEGIKPLFLTLSEPDQHRLANRLIRTLSARACPDNQDTGRRLLVSALDAREALSDLGIDLPGAVREVELSLSSPLQLPLGQ